MKLDKAKLIGSAPVIISLFAFFVSLIGVILSARSYVVTHRPYIGIIEMPFKFVGDPPSAMLWSMVIKNVGSVPGFFSVEENSAFISSQSGISQLKTFGSIGQTGTMLMPGQLAELSGQYNESSGPVRMKDILAGTANLNIEARLKYKSPGLFWPNRYYYRSNFQFQVIKGVVPRFAMISAEAD